MSKNVVEPEGPQMAIWRMRVACWIIAATVAKAHAHTEMCNKYCFSTTRTFS